MMRKRQYLWVDQDFYNYVESKVQKMKGKGYKTNGADLTQRLVPILEKNLKVEVLFPQIIWKQPKKTTRKK